LLAEPDTEVIVVDNGSLDGSRGYLASTGVNCLLLDHNAGQSIGRNMGIACTRAPYVMMLDGDILYVPGTLTRFKRILDENPKLGCVGVFGGEATVTQLDQADTEAPELYGLNTDHPIAWTQYGLFRREVLDECPLDESGWYALPGHGFEDNDLYQQMKVADWESGAVRGLKYYHERSTGVRKLLEYGLPKNDAEREAQLIEKWKL
jgi:glycosyltransferase involved in cell wall biosynthesis